jgi:hypothetical protein
MARPSTSYEPRRPAGTVLHRIVQDHFETFLAQAARFRDGDGLPPFVEHAFRDFLRCGFLAGGSRGFAATAAPWTGWSPSRARGGRSVPVAVVAACRLRAKRYGEPRRSLGGGGAERAVHLVDHLLPDLPVRQWVLSLPHRLRYRLAWDHDLCRRVTTVFLRAVFRLLRDHARAVSLEQPRGGAVAIIQRFGGALNLNVYIHALVLDGVFARDAAGGVGHLSFCLEDDRVTQGRRLGTESLCDPRVATTWRRR